MAVTPEQVKSDIEAYIARLTDVSEEAIRLAAFFAQAAKWSNFSPPTVTPPAGLPSVLIDPTFADTSVVPVMPTFGDLSVVAPPDVTMNPDSFSDTLPEPPPPFVAATPVSFNEAYPEQWLIDRVKTSIRKLWTETGFESVEIDIYEKETERNLQALYDAEDDTIAKHSMSGWSMPNDMLDRDLDTLNEKFDDNRIAVNADITAKMIDLAQKNAQYAIEHGINGEAMLIAYFNRYADRALKAAKAAASDAFEGIKAKAIGYGAYLKTKEVQMRAEARVETSMVQGYDAFLDAKMTEMDAKVDALSSVLSAYKSLIGSYRTVISAEGSKSETEMSWREIKYKENLVGIQVRLETAIANMSAENAANSNSQAGDVADTTTKVHNVSAILREIQVMIHEASLDNKEETA